MESRAALIGTVFRMKEVVILHHLQQLVHLQGIRIYPGNHTVRKAGTWSTFRVFSMAKTGEEP